MQYRITLFGGLRIEHAQNSAIRFRTRKGKLLLAYLATFPGEHSRKELAQLFFPKRPIDRALLSLRVELSSLRHTFEDSLHSLPSPLRITRDTVAFDPEAALVDIHQFEWLLAQAEQIEGQAKISLLEQACNLYSGDYMKGFNASWIRSKRLELKQKFEQAIEQACLGYIEYSEYDKSYRLIQKYRSKIPLELFVRLNEYIEKSKKQKSKETYTSQREPETRIVRSPSGLTTFAALLGTTSKSLTHLTRQCVALGGTVILSSEKLLITAFNNPIKAGQWVVGAVEADEGMAGALMMEIWAPEKNPSTISALQQMVLSLNDGWIICTEPVAYWFQRECEWTLQETRYYFLSNSNRLFLVNPKQAGGFPFRTSHSSLLRERKIPVPTTPLWGREQELATLHQWFASECEQESSRLLTLVGIGGIGKTHLALEFAHQVSLLSYEEVVFVNLENSKTICDVENDILASFGEDFPRMRVDLTQVLRERRSLLILDHVEHLQPVLAKLLPQWLSIAPQIRILITSRVPIGLPYEKLLLLNPLPVPPEGVEEPSELLTYSSVRLFIEEVRRTRPNFILSSHNARTVADICRYSGGIPLALTLFAMRMNVYTPTQLLATLQKQGVGGNPVNIAAAWSFHHLPDEQKDILCKLSIFFGNWTLESAREILQEPLIYEYLDRLQRIGLVLVDPRDDAYRFTVPSLIREYAQQFLEPTSREELKFRFAQYYIRLVQQILSDSPVLTQEQLLQMRLYKEQILTSIEWAIGAGEVEAVASLIIALVPYFENLGIFEAPIKWGEHLLTCSLTPALQARLLSTLARLYHRIGNLQVAEHLYLQAHSVADSFHLPTASAEAIVGISAVYLDRFCIAKAAENAHKALVQYQDFLSPKIEADALFRLGYALSAQLQHEQAYECWKRAESLYRQIGDKRYLALTLSALGRLFLQQEIYPEAESVLKESLDILQEIQDRAFLPYALLRWGDLQREYRKHEEAIQAYRESLRLAKDIHITGAQRSALARLGEEYYSLRRYRLAKQSFREACEISPALDINPESPPLVFAWNALLSNRLDEAETILIQNLNWILNNRSFSEIESILKLSFLIFKRRKFHSYCSEIMNYIKHIKLIYIKKFCKISNVENSDELNSSLLDYQVIKLIRSIMNEINQIRKN